MLSFQGVNCSFCWWNNNPALCQEEDLFRGEFLWFQIQIVSWFRCGQSAAGSGFPRILFKVKLGSNSYSDITSRWFLVGRHFQNLYVFRFFHPFFWWSGPLWPVVPAFIQRVFQRQRTSARSSFASCDSLERSSWRVWRWSSPNKQIPMWIHQLLQLHRRGWTWGPSWRLLEGLWNETYINIYIYDKYIYI